MTPQFQPHAEHAETVCVSRIIPVLFGVLFLMGEFAPAALASPVDCQSIDFLRGGPIGDGPKWKGTSLQILPPLLTVQRDLYDSLSSAPVEEAAPLLRSSRFGRGHIENRGIKNSAPCWGQPFRKHSLVDQAMFKSLGKGLSKSFIHNILIPAPPPNGKRQILKTRTILPDLAIAPREKTPNIIGPVQEHVTADQSGIPSLDHALAIRPFPGESLPLFEGRTILQTDPLRPSFRLPGNESLRMNVTTTQALHGGNCANGCP